MAHVDFLSRSLEPTEMPTHAHKNPKYKRVLLPDITDNWLLTEQQKDSETSSIISKIHNNELGESVAKTYKLRSKLLFRKIQRNGKT